MKGIQSPYEPRHETQAPEELPVPGHHPDDAWQDEIGAYQQRSGLSVACGAVQIMGQIGRRA